MKAKGVTADERGERWIKIKNKGPSDRGGPSCEYSAEGSAETGGPVHARGRRFSRQRKSRRQGQDRDPSVVAVIGGVSFRDGGMCAKAGQDLFPENRHHPSPGDGDA